MGTYVVGDIHGCYDLWIKLKNMIETQDKEAKFILVGDIVDRGPNVLGMIQWAMENITPNGKYRMVLGNHEDLKINWWTYYKKYKNNLISKGKECGVDMAFPEHYGFDEIIVNNGLSEEYVEEIIQFFNSLPLVIEEDIETNSKMIHYIIVHGGVVSDYLTTDGKFNYEVLTNDYHSQYGYVNLANPRECLMWDRNYFGNNWKHDTVIVHGHSTTLSRDLVARGAVPGLIDFRRKDINVDCGAVFQSDGGQLAAIRLEDLEEFYVKSDYDYSLHEYRENSRMKQKHELSKQGLFD